MDTTTHEEKTKQILNLIQNEVSRAKSMFPGNFVNQHEGYAVLLEEVDELWDEIKKNQKNYDLLAQKKEAIQVAAMAVRICVELLYDAN
jgi:NTP pyrophosphatase (non-canonical NTP hydrolase)